MLYSQKVKRDGLRSWYLKETETHRIPCNGRVTLGKSCTPSNDVRLEPSNVHNCHGIVSPTSGWGTLGCTRLEMYTLFRESRSGDGSAYAATTKGRLRPVRGVQNLRKRVRSLECTTQMYLVTLQKIRMGYARFGVRINQIKSNQVLLVSETCLQRKADACSKQ